MTALTIGIERDLRDRRRRLGYAGLLPFAACLAFLLFSTHTGWRAQAATGMLHYAALIAAFLGAVHWGVSREETRERRHARLVWGVVPAVAAWLLLQLPTDIALLAFALLFVLMLSVDRHHLPLLDAGYRALRLQLTMLVTTMLALAAANVWGTV